jgi:hypothetical protein
VRHITLQERVKETRLNVGQVWDLVAGAMASKVANVGGLEAADGACCH